MYINKIKIDPLDLQPRKAVGVNLPFSGQAIFNSTYQTKDAIKVNLINLILTSQGERYMHPEIGTPILKEYIFSNSTDESKDLIKTIIQSQIAEYFPKVFTKSIDIIENIDRNSVNIVINYSIRDTNIEDEITIEIQE